MFLKKIDKGPKGGKVYSYYRLCESIRIGDKTRHNNLLNLGTLENLQPDELKMLANRIEDLYIGNSNNLFSVVSDEVEKLAVKYYKELRKKLEIAIDIPPNKNSKNTDIQFVEEDFERIDLKSIRHDEIREVGAEWLCLQAIRELGLEAVLAQTGMGQQDINKAISLIVSRAVYPASEHKTSQWMSSSSSVTELVFGTHQHISHQQLYLAGDALYAQKAVIEQHFCSKTNELFDLKDKIVFYDLTNTYFEGRKANSQLAQFGRSKEKRSDCKLVSLALVVNAQGFVKYSKIYEGNIYEAHTLATIVDALATNTSFAAKPIVVVDAGIADEANLLMLKSKGYDYLCVTKAKLKEYTAINPDTKPVEITDKKGGKIALKAIAKPDCEDQFLHIRSEQKAVKEASMNAHYSARFEAELSSINTSIQSKGGTKKIEKVHERIGRIKERYPAANKHYTIDVQQDDNLATGLTFAKKVLPIPSQTDGVYFLRTSIKQAGEKLIWDIYNTLTQIEATFRVLKTDLNIRPVFHQKDERTMAHIQLGILAYMVVNTIRYKLKTANIHHDWQNIIRIMNTQKMVKTSFKNDKQKVIIIKKCSEPIAEVLEIYQATKYKPKPFSMKKYVLPQ